MTSAFAQGFQMGSEMYDSSERMKLAKAAEDRASKEFSWREKEQQGKEGLRQAALEMEQTGDTVPVQSGVGATGGIDEGGFTLQQQPITQEQKVANFRRRALELGASPEAIQQHELSGYQVAAARRSNDIDNRFDKTMNSLHEDSAKRLNDIQTTAEQEGMNGLYKKFSPELKKAYPGMDIQQVGNSIVLTHGKQKQVINNLSEAVSALQGAAQAEFSTNLENRMLSEGLFRNATELTTYLKNRREADIHQGFYGKGGVYETTHMASVQASRDNAAMAAGRHQTEGQKLNERIDALAGAYRKADPNLSPEEASRRAAMVVTRDPEARNNVVTAADINTFLSNNAGVVVGKDLKTGKAQRLSDLPLEKQSEYARRVLGNGGGANQQPGGLADLGKDGLGDPNATKTTTTEEPAPAEDTKHYTRAKGPRGNWVYTWSPRGGGKTRAEWAQVDAQANK